MFLGLPCICINTISLSAADTTSNILKSAVAAEISLIILKPFEIAYLATSDCVVSIDSVEPLNDEIKHGFLLPYNNWENRIATHEFVLDIPLIENHRSYKTLLAVEEGLGQLKDLPMTIIWGKYDWCFDMTFLAQWKEFFTNATVHEMEAGHYLLEDKGQ